MNRAAAVLHAVWHDLVLFNTGTPWVPWSYFDTTSIRIHEYTVTSLTRTQYFRRSRTTDQAESSLGIQSHRSNGDGKDCSEYSGSTTRESPDSRPQVFRACATYTQSACTATNHSQEGAVVLKRRSSQSSALPARPRLS